MKTRKMPLDLYKCYVIHFGDVCKPLSRRKFADAVGKMKPGKRAKLEEDLRKTPAQRFREEKEAAERVLHEYETDPRVRRRVAREGEVAMGKALTRQGR